MRRTKHFLILGLALSLFVFTGCSSDSSSPSSLDTDVPDDSLDNPALEVDGSALRERLQNVVDEAVASGLPGVSLHVQRGDAQISVVAGVVNRATGEPVTPDSLFNIASVGKTYVATLILRLSDQGLLQLEDPIDTWLDPEISSAVRNSDRITVEMLLAHTSGIPDYLNNISTFAIDFIASPTRDWTAIEILGYISDTDNFFEPGAEYAYSNTNYLLLGLIAERVTGVSLNAGLRQFVFEPAGLDQTYGLTENLGQPGIAHGYAPVSAITEINPNFDLPATDGDIDTIEWLSSGGFGDAPIQSSPRDMNQFLRTLLETDVLLTDELRTRMLTESFDDSSQYGLGIATSNNGDLIGHSGSHFGLLTLSYYSRSKNTSLSSAVNASMGVYNNLVQRYLANLDSILKINQ